LFRQAIRATLESQPGLCVVSTVADASQAVAESDRHRPDIVLLTGPDSSHESIQATLTIRDRFPDTRVVFVGDDADRSFPVEALQAGASGYLTNNCALDDLVHAVRAVVNGQTYVAPHVVSALVEHIVRSGRERHDSLRLLAKLTSREREVLALLSAGGDNESIANDLFISTQTARTHVQNVLTKLGLHSRRDATAFAMQEGVVEMLNDLEIANRRSRRPGIFEHAADSDRLTPTPIAGGMGRASTRS
jgi:DNA-binding NarL/FixJ family response regulator